MPKPFEMPSEPEPTIARVIVEVAPFHLDRPFDYLLGDFGSAQVGQRVLVPFAGRRVRGLICELAETTDVPRGRLRPIARALGDHVWAHPDEIDTFRWAARRFGGTVADVVRHALPSRVVDVERKGEEAGWFPHVGERPVPVADLPDPPDWTSYDATAQSLLEAVHGGRGSFVVRPLPGARIAEMLVDLIARALRANRDALVIVPDAGSPAAAQVIETFSDLAADLRGGQSSRSHYRQWLRARAGAARVVVGERGAAFAPLDRLGLAIVVDEANPALKERRSPRHHAREVVLERARRAGGAGVLITTVPSAPAWRLIQDRRVTPVVPTRDAERKARPHVVVVDWQTQPRTRLSLEALASLRTAVESQAYAVVLATRRGEGRVLVCSRCGERVACPKCGSAVGMSDAGMHCEGCGYSSKAALRCRECDGRRISPVAAGTTWIARELEQSMHIPVTVLEGYEPTFPPPPAVVVVTRGAVLDAPPGPVGAVVLADIDSSLRRPTLDAAEDCLRLSMAVAAWTVDSVSSSAGTVVVQTVEPDHHAVTSLQRWNPGEFWRVEALLRQPLGFPPARAAIRLDVEASTAGLEDLDLVLPDSDELLGPIVSGGRAGFLIKTDDRAATLAALHELRAGWSKAGVDVRVDVDPVDAL